MRKGNSTNYEFDDLIHLLKNTFELDKYDKVNIEDLLDILQKKTKQNSTSCHDNVLNAIIIATQKYEKGNKEKEENIKKLIVRGGMHKKILNLINSLNRYSSYIYVSNENNK